MGLNETDSAIKIPTEIFRNHQKFYNSLQKCIRIERHACCRRTGINFEAQLSFCERMGIPYGYLKEDIIILQTFKMFRTLKGRFIIIAGARDAEPMHAGRKKLCVRYFYRPGVPVNLTSVKEEEEVKERQ